MSTFEAMTAGIHELESALNEEQYDGLLPFLSGVMRDANLRQKP